MKINCNIKFAGTMLLICLTAFVMMGCGKVKEKSSGLMIQSYYYYDNNEEIGDFIWVYKFIWNENKTGGHYTAYAYYPNGAQVTSTSKQLENIKVGINGSFEMQQNDTILLKIGDGIDVDGYVTKCSFCVVCNADGSLSDSSGNTYLSGSPGFNTDINSDTITSVVICEQSKDSNWEIWIDESEGADGESFLTDDGLIVLNICDSGKNPWSTQIKYNNVTLEKDAYYRVSFKYMVNTSPWILSGYGSANHSVGFGFLQNYEPYKVYYEESLKLTGDEYKNVERKFVMHEDTDTNVFFGFNCGALELVNTDAKVCIKDFKLEKFID